MNYGMFDDELKKRKELYSPYMSSPQSSNLFGGGPKETIGNSLGGSAMAGAAMADPTGTSQIMSMLGGGNSSTLQMLSDPVGSAFKIYGSYKDQQRADEAERYNRGIADSQWKENRANVTRDIMKEDRKKKWTEDFMRALAGSK
jgi:hypothetical protein